MASDGSAGNFSFSSGNTPTYGKNNATLQSEGWITAEGVLAPAHDAAQVHWGGGWRMPTDQELNDLCYHQCDWTWTATNGVNGYLVRGRGDFADASIFVPAAGRGYGNFPRLPFISTYSYHGCVYASGIGNSTVPNYAMADTLVAAQDQKPFLFTDPYGNYGAPFLTMPTYSWTRNRGPQAFHFGADGIIDYSALALNRVQAHIDASRAGYSNWVADTVSADLRVRGRRVSFTNIVASAYGGDVRADVSFFPVGVDEDWRFELSLHSLSNLDLSAFFDDTLGEHLESAPRGFLSGSGRLSGYIYPDPKASLDTLDGSFAAVIRDGFIFQAGLFSGFSDLVSYVLPGFSLFAQTEATGTFRFGRGRVRTDDLKVMGSVFSVNAEGAYGFDNSLDFVFELKLLRSGAVAYFLTINIVGFPGKKAEVFADGREKTADGRCKFCTYACGRRRPA